MDPARRAALEAKRAAAGQAREAAAAAEQARRGLRISVFLAEGLRGLDPLAAALHAPEVAAAWEALGARAGFRVHGMVFAPPEAPGALVQGPQEARAAFLARIARLVAGDPPCTVIEDLRGAGLRCAPEAALAAFETLGRELPGHVAIIGAGMRWALLARGSMPLEFARFGAAGADASAQGGAAPHSRPQGG